MSIFGAFSAVCYTFHPYSAKEQIVIVLGDYNISSAKAEYDPTDKNL